MKRSEYPNSAFAYVSEDEAMKLLLHHGPDVQSENEHTTVDPVLLAFALEIFDSLPIPEEKKSKVRRHLQAHANVTLFTDPNSEGLPIALHDKLRNFAFFKANLDGAATVPPVTTEGRGTVYAMLNKSTRELQWFIEFISLSSAQVQSHFHRGMDGKLGEIVIAFPNGSPENGSQIVSEDFVKDLYQGNIYCNIHSEAYPIGEIRGRMIPAATSRSNNSVGDEGDGTIKASKDVAETTREGVRPKKPASMPTTPKNMASDKAETIRGADHGETETKRKKKKPNDKMKSRKGILDSMGVQVKPPVEKKPKAQTPHLQPGNAENENGAVYSKEPIVPPGQKISPTEEANLAENGGNAGTEKGLQVRPPDHSFTEDLGPSEQVSPPKSKNSKRKKLRSISEALIPPGQKLAPIDQANLDQNGGGGMNRDMQVLPEGQSFDKDLGPGEQVRPPELGPTENLGPGMVVTAPDEVKPRGQIYEGTQVEPDRKSGGGGPDQITPPDEAKPSADVRQVHKQGERGAILSQDEKKKNKPKAQIRQLDAPVYSGTRFDFGQVAVNIGTTPEFESRSPERRRSVMEFGNSTGAPNQPSAATDAEKSSGLKGGVPKVTISNLKDRDNSDLRKIIQSEGVGQRAPRPGVGNIKDDGRVIQLFTQDDIGGRTIIFPSTGSVIKVEAASQTVKSINNLPDAAFAVIERGGRKDAQSKTAPRTLRHLPHHTSSVKNTSDNKSLDLLRLRNALARMNQVKAGESDNADRIRRVARSHLIRHAKAVLPNSNFAKSDGKVKLSQIIAEFDLAICHALIDGHIAVVRAQVLKVEELSSRTFVRVDMGTKDDAFPFFVTLRKDGTGKVTSVMFDFDTWLPSEFVADFAKFLKGLDIKKD